jgi:hypothetical protein
MTFIRTMRGPTRTRSASFVPGSLACAARRVALSTEVRFTDRIPSEFSSPTTSGEAVTDPTAPCTESDS